MSAELPETVEKLETLSVTQHDLDKLMKTGWDDWSIASRKSCQAVTIGP